MARLRLLDAFTASMADVSTLDALREILADVARDLGFDYFALAEHIDLRDPRVIPVQVHNYPDSWAAYYIDRDLGPRDPVRRASHRTQLGFAWATIPRILTMTAADRAVLAAGHSHGIGDGFTVPFHIPGEVSGSCSFATRVDRVLRPFKGMARRRFFNEISGESPKRHGIALDGEFSFKTCLR